MPSQDKHELVTEIKAEYGDTIAKALEYANAIGTLATNFGKAQEHMTGLSGFTKDLNLDFKKQLEEVFKLIGVGGGATVKLTKTKLKENIKEKFEDAISNFDPEIVLANDGDNKVTLSVSDTLKQKLQIEYEKALTKFVDVTEIDPNGMVPIKLPLSAMTNMQERFKKVFMDDIEKINFVWDRKRVEKGMKIDQMPLASFELNGEHLQSLFNKVRDRFIEELKKPDMINLQNVKKMEIPVGELNKAVDLIRESIGNLDESLKVDATKLMELPKVQTRITDLKTNLQLIVGTIYQITESAKDIGLTEEDKKKLEQVQTKIKGLSQGILTKVVNDIGEMTKGLKGKAEFSQADLAQVMQPINKIKEIVREFVEVEIVKAEEILRQQSIAPPKIRKNSKEATENFTTFSKIQNDIINASKKALENLDTHGVVFNTAPVIEGINAWAEKVVLDLKANVDTELASVGLNLARSQRTVIEGFYESLLKVSKLKLGPKKVQEGLEVKISSEEIFAEITEQIKGLVTEYLGNIKPTDSAKAKLDKGLEITQPMVVKMETALKGTLNKMVDDVVLKLNAHEPSTLGSEEISALDRVLSDESRAIVSRIVAEARSISNSLSESFYTGNSKGISKEEHTQMAQSLKETANKVVSEYGNMFEGALGAFVITASTVEDIHNKISSELNVFAKKTNIELSDYDTPFMIKGIVRKLQVEVQKAIRQNVEAWRPSLEAFNPNMDFEALVSSLRDPMQNMVRQMSLDFEHELRKLYDTSKIEFTDEHTPIQAKGVVKKAQQKLQSAIKGNVEAWDPTEGLEPFEPKINYKKVGNAVEQLVNNMLNHAVSNVKDRATAIKTSSIHTENDTNNNEINNAKAESEGYFNPKTELHLINESVLRYVSNYVHYVSRLIREFTAEVDNFSVSKKSLNADVRKSIAQKLDMSVKDWMKDGNEMSGDEDFKNILHESVNSIYRKFHDVVQSHTSDIIKEYKTELKNVKLEPDTSVVYFLADQLHDMQSAITKKIRDVLRAQFNAMKDELKAMRIGTQSMGYEVPKGVVNELERTQKAQVVQQIVVANQVPRDGGGYVGRYTAYNNGYSKQNFGNEGSYGNGTDYYNETKSAESFKKSIVNTMRYIMAGSLMGVPSMLLYQAFDSAKTYDYEMEKARQNFMIDGGKATLAGNGFSSKDVNRSVQDIGIMNGVSMDDSAKAFQIASRTTDNSAQALQVTREITKMKSLEDIDIIKASEGLESVLKQWGQKAGASKDMTNMMIIGSNISNASIEDILDAQSRSGALFNQNLKGMGTAEKFATSVALTSIFKQATGRSGTEAGTFFKAMLQRPYTKQGRQELETMSEDKRFKDLNPYYTDKDGVKRQKNFLDLFGSILDVSDKLNDSDRANMWSKLVPGWHSGSMGAIDSFTQGLKQDVEEMKKNAEKKGGKSVDTDKDGKVSSKEALEFVVKKIYDKNDPNALKNNADTVTNMQMGMANTWAYQGRKMKSEFEVSLVDVFGNLKDEFSSLSVYISTLLRYVRDNASTFAEMVKKFVQVGAYALGKQGVKLLKNQLQQRKEEKLNNMFGENVRYLNEEGRYHNLRRLALSEEMGSHRDSYNNALEKHNSANSRLAEIDNELNGIGKQREEHQEAHDHADKRLKESKPGEDTQDLTNTLVRSGRALEGLDEEEKKLIAEQKKLTAEASKYSREMTHAQKNMQGLEDEMISTNNSMAKVNGRYKALTMAMEDMGLDATKLKVKFNELQSGMSETSAGSNSLERNLTEIGERAGLSEGQISELRSQVEKLNQEFKDGDITAEEYIKSLNKLERQHQLGSMGFDGVGGNFNRQNGRGLVDTAIEGSMFESSMNGAEDMPKSLGNRIGAMLTTAGTLIFGRKLMGATGGWLGKLKGLFAEGGKLGSIGKIFSMGGKFGQVLKLGKLGKAIPYVGEALLGMDAGDAMFDAMFAQGMNKYEKTKEQGSRRETVANDIKSASEGGFFQKFLFSFDTLFKMPMSGLNHMFGGNMTSFSEYGKALKDYALYSGDELDKHLKKDLGYEEKKREAFKQEEEERLKKLDMFDQNHDGIVDRPQDRTTPISFEDVQTYLEGLQDRLSMSQSRNDTAFTVGTTKLLINGNSQNSASMRMAKEGYISTTMADMNQALKDVTDRMNTLEGGTDTQSYITMEKYAQELKNNLANLKLQQYQNKMSVVDDINEKMGIGLNYNQSRSGIQRSNLLMNGYREDSTELRKTMKEFFTKNIEVLNIAINKIGAQMSTVPVGSDKWYELRNDKASLESQKAEQKLQLFQNDFSEVDNIMNNMQDKLTLQNGKFEIQKDNAILGGAQKDSSVLKGIENNRVYSTNSIMQGAESQLRALLTKYDGKQAQRNQILLAIQQLQVEQKNQLVGIKDTLDYNKSTFNLPSGVQPMGYFDYVMSRGTNKNVSVSQGDVKINVTIGNMSGAQNDVDKVTKSITDAVKKAQKDLVNAFTTNVTSGMGTNYPNMG